MELEKQVCNFELAKKLKELGVKQDSLFYWWEDKGQFVDTDRFGEDRYCSRQIEFGEDSRNHWHEIKISAFTVAELGNLLPILVKSDNVTYFLNSNKFFAIRDGELWAVTYSRFHCGCNNCWCKKHTPELNNKEEVLISMEYENEADARAGMLIHLIENNLIKIQDINLK